MALRNGAPAKVSRWIDWCNAWLGRTVAWLILLSIVVSAGNAIARKLFDLGSNSFLQLQWHLFGAVFMLCAAWTLRLDEHVRIDIIYSKLSPRKRSWVDLFGHVFFLIPFAGLLSYLSYSFFMRSFLQNEASADAGGLLLWPPKGFVLLGFLLLLIQAISEIIKCAANIAAPDEPAQDQ
ncbi:TRAP transporter small permease subunit [Castellaniella sp. S9]|uniref:TRAP transporter small permease subunit n=1 Tax=Castellaniella sp. S9 TaxID=2993652 RepID=UPI0022B33C0A|nr:TRAP transporter small permease subunit [Castellaniella sp. S9]